MAPGGRCSSPCYPASPAVTPALTPVIPALPPVVFPHPIPLSSPHPYMLSTHPLPYRPCKPLRYPRITSCHHHTPSRYPHIPSCRDPTSQLVTIPHPLLLLSHILSRCYPTSSPVTIPASLYIIPPSLPVIPAPAISQPASSPPPAPQTETAGGGYCSPQLEGFILDAF